MSASDSSFRIATKHMATFFELPSFIKQILIVYHGPGTLRDPGNNKMGEVSTFMDLRFAGKSGTT